VNPLLHCDLRTRKFANELTNIDRGLDAAGARSFSRIIAQAPQGALEIRVKFQQFFQRRFHRYPNLTF